MLFLRPLPLWLLLLAAPVAADPTGCANPAFVDTQAMGTRIRAHICPAGADAAAVQVAQAGRDAVMQEFQRLEGLWSTWRPDSDIARLNRAAPQAAKIAPETARILLRSLQASRDSGGLFDVTFAPLGQLWQFDTPPGSHEPTQLRRVPTPAEVKALLPKVGFGHLHVDGEKQTAQLDLAGAAVHLGGIGKGAAVDSAVAVLRGLRLRDFCVQAGGDLYCSGQNGQRPWRIGIAHPRQKGALIGVVQVRDAAFSTSGDYERFAIIDGVRYHHILDLRTGFPATASQSATVLAKTATDAEVLTKWAFIVGGQAGLQLLADHGAQGVLVDAAGKVWRSAGIDVQAAEGGP